MSKAKFSAQAEKLKNLVDSARLQTSSSAVTATAPSQPNEGAEVVSGRPVAARTKAKNPHNAFKRHTSDTFKVSDSLLTYCTITFKLLSYSLNNI